MPILRLLPGDCRQTLQTLPENSVQTCVTSPPYWNLRDYNHPGQIGLEPDFDTYLQALLPVFVQVRRVLRPDGTLWVNMGDCRLKKQLVGQPWRLAFALQSAGWFLRADIIWHKPNPMPESIDDRPTQAHEYLFLLSKSERYYYDAEAVKEPVTGGAHPRGHGVNPKAKVPTGWDTGEGDHAGKVGRYKTPGRNSRIHVNRDPNHNCVRKSRQNESFSAAVVSTVSTRNKRSVWTIATHPYPDAHFATFPPDLVKPCVLAGSKPGDTVLDPFGGSGTTGQVALDLGRHAILCELNPDYLPLIKQRCQQPGLHL